MADFRALCAEILQTLDQYEDGQRVDWDAWRETARAALAQPKPVVELAAKLIAESKPMDPEMAAALTTEARWGLYEGSLTPHPELVAPTDEELLELMPETMRDEFSYAAKVCSDATKGKVKPGFFRVVLNAATVEYAHAVLARWGTPANNTRDHL